MGDYNIDLFKVNLKSKVADFFDHLVTNSFFPKISFSTCFSERNGTLIDNFFCKLSTESLNSKSGILINQFSDLLPYFLLMNVKICKKTPARTINVYSNTPQAMNNFCEEIINSPALNGINQEEIRNPNDTYEISEKVIEDA